MQPEIREYHDADDFQGVRKCLVELQDHERALDPRLPAGDTIADAYLQGLFRRCARRGSWPSYAPPPREGRQPPGA